jgi:Protein of unknown function (DUF4058)
MRPQFPGMDPWLEHPTVWPDVHSSLITAIRDALTPVLAPRYFVGVQSRVTLVTGLDVDLLYRPDASVHALELGRTVNEPRVALIERPVVTPIPVTVAVDDRIEDTYLEIREPPNHKLVTAIEVLSPWNEKTEAARQEYLTKRTNLFRARVSVIEIDLLRAGAPMPLEDAPAPSDYRILICRRGVSSRADLYSFNWRTPIPPIPIPLLPGETEPTLDLNSVLLALIDRARYDLVIDYSQPPSPRLRPEDEAWAADMIAKARNQEPQPNGTEGLAP